jgi:hypothetical protein
VDARSGRQPPHPERDQSLTALTRRGTHDLAIDRELDLGDAGIVRGVGDDLDGGQRQHAAMERSVDPDARRDDRRQGDGRDDERDDDGNARQLRQ